MKKGIILSMLIVLILLFVRYDSDNDKLEYPEEDFIEHVYCDDDFYPIYYDGEYYTVIIGNVGYVFLDLEELYDWSCQ